jgi:putative toxin-antitoxin system antitoxin component (TIGR02293 family)
VPYHSIAVVAERLGVDPESLLEIIGMAPRTAARRKASGQLKPEEADRLFRIVRVFDEAVRVFDSPGKAATSLRTPPSAALAIRTLAAARFRCGRQGRHR